MSRDKIHGKSFNSSENLSCTPRYVNVFKDITSFPYYEKKYRENREKLRHDYLLQKLRNLKPKDKKKLMDNKCDCDSSLDESSDSKEQIFNTRKMSLSKRKQMIKANCEKGQEKNYDFSNRDETKKVCEKLNESSSRLEEKMQRNDNDCSRGKRYSKEEFFEKFPYGNGATNLEAMNNSCSSIDVPIYRIEKKAQQTKPSRNKNKKISTNNKVGGCKKSNKLPSSTSLVVNYSPELDFDSYQDKRKISTHNENSNNICQCSSESDYEDNIPDKNCEERKNSETYICCCADEKKIKAGCSNYCRCPGYRDETNNHETYANFQPKYFATPFKDSEKPPPPPPPTLNDHNGKLKKNRNHDIKRKMKQTKTSELNLSDLTPDIPMPKHWSQYGDHMTNVTNEYRQLLNNFKKIQSMALNSNPRKLRKKFTRTYPSGKKFTFEVKPANDFNKGEHISYCCQSKNCPQLLRCLKKNMKKSSILDGYNNLVKSHAVRKNNNKHFTTVKKIHTKGKLSDISSCICQRKTNKSKETFLTKNCHLEGKKIINSVSEKSSAMDKNLNSEDNDKSVDKCGNVVMEKNRNDLRKFNFPRIVKTKGVLCRDSMRKIFIYPPNGEEGSPLTLNKKCSNIDCRIEGDSRNGFRYKVTYKQEFLSPVWYPEEKESPFRKKENTTEYG